MMCLMFSSIIGISRFVFPPIWRGVWMRGSRRGSATRKSSAASRRIGTEKSGSKTPLIWRHIIGSITIFLMGPAFSAGCQKSTKRKRDTDGWSTRCGILIVPICRSPRPILRSPFLGTRGIFSIAIRPTISKEIRKCSAAFIRSVIFRFTTTDLIMPCCEICCASIGADSSCRITTASGYGSGMRPLTLSRCSGNTPLGKGRRASARIGWKTGLSIM